MLEGNNSLYNANGFTIKSVRVYNRALSEEEVAQNTALDQIRYSAVPKVEIGGQECTNVAVISSTELQCIAPPGNAGTVNVEVSAGDGSGYFDTLSGYTYIDDNATDNFYVFSQSTNHGTKNATIQFTGNQLNTVNAVAIIGNADNNSCAIDSSSLTSTELTCEIPNQTNYSNNTKDIVFTYDIGGGAQTLTLTQAWTYDTVLTVNLGNLPPTTINLSPSPITKDTVTDTVEYTVDTNNAYGYRVLIKTSNTSREPTHQDDLLCEINNNKYYLPALPNQTGTLDHNTWAYKYGRKGDSNNLSWLPPKSTANVAYQSERQPTAPGSPDEKELTIGARVDYGTQACDGYTGMVEVVFETLRE
jgi:hypothetical protein